MHNPLVSIIIPTKNRASFLQYALTSCINQSYTHLQIIVQDNNSSDNTREVVQKDKRIEYYNSKCDLTMQDNWNSAVSYIKGDYFLRLDDDNVISTTIIKEALEKMQANNLNCLAYSPISVYPNRKLIQFFKEDKSIYVLNANQLTYLTYYCLIDSNYIIYNTKLVRKLRGKQFYTTTLPDRHLDYIIACNMQKEKIRYGLSTEIKGITRHDYQRNDKNAEMNTLNISKIKKAHAYANGMNINNIDCHNNFMLHRYITLMTALKSQQNSSLSQYVSKQITTPNIYETIHLIGNLYCFTGFSSIGQFIAYFKLFSYVIFRLLINPKLIIERKSAYIQIILLFKTAISRLPKILFARRSQKIDLTFGNGLCKRMILNKNIDTAGAEEEIDNIRILLKKILKKGSFNSIFAK